MKLEDLARDAAEELCARTVPDLTASFEDLRRTRTRRALRAVAAVVVLLLVGGGVALVLVDHRANGPGQPVGPPSVRNGAIVSGDDKGVSLLSGQLVIVPHDAEAFSPVQFTADGSELVYRQQSGGLIAMNVTTGVTRFLTPCGARNCMGAQLSPDGTRVALPTQDGGRYGVELRTLSSDATVFLPTQGSAVYWPRWSPDGKYLLVSGAHGLYLMSVDGGPSRLLYRYPPGSYGRPASWSPDGSTIAFLAPRPLQSGHGGISWTLMTVKPDGTGLHLLRRVGRCFCVGIAPPAVAWSPDGGQIVVTVISSGHSVTDARAGGLYSIHPDGTGWTDLRAPSTEDDANYLAWQPLPEQ